MPKISTRDEYLACLVDTGKLAPQLARLKELKVNHNQKLKQLHDEMAAQVATQPNRKRLDVIGFICLKYVAIRLKCHAV